MNLFPFISKRKVDEQIEMLKSSLTSEFRDALGQQLKAARLDGYNRATRNFNAASTSPLLDKWSTTESTVNAIIKQGFVAVRTRARELARNNDYMKGFIRDCRMNILNQASLTGFTLQPWVKEFDSKGVAIEFPDEDAKILRMYEDFARPEHCSHNGRFSLRGLLDLVVMYLVRDGEAFIRVVRRKKSKYGIVLQIIGPEYIDETYNAKLTDTTYVQLGIELDADRRPLGYWMKSRRPEHETAVGGINTWKRERIDASEIIHIYDAEYENQIRGISWGVQSMVNMHMLGNWDFAAVVNATISASKTFWIIQKENASGPGYTAQGKDAEGNTQMDVQPGGGEELKEGQDVKIFDPKYPDPMHEMFDRTMGRKIAKGLGVSYGTLTGDLSQANYGSQRVGMLSEREYWKLGQQLIIEKALMQIYPQLLESAWLVGKLAIRIPYGERYEGENWVGRTWGWIDPEKDIIAEKEARASGSLTYTQALAERGLTLEQQLKELAYEQKKIKEYGVEISLTTSAAKEKVKQDAAAQSDKKNADGAKRTNGAMVHTN